MNADKKINVVFIGDSITDYGTFPSIIETYFTINNSLNKFNFINIGLSSETLSGLTEPTHPFHRPCVFERLNKIIETTKPDLAIVLYGVNDGIYYPFSDQRFQAFKDGVKKIVDTLHATGSKVALMTPTPLDHLSLNSPMFSDSADEFSFNGIYEFYDDVMSEYSSWIKECKLAEQVVDVRSALIEFFDERRKINPNFSDGDGIHFQLFGNYIIAKAIGEAVFGAKLEMQRSKEYKKLYHLILKKNILLHKNLKETIGHSSPSKDKFLPNHLLEKEVGKIEKKIDNLVFRGTGTQKHSLYHNFDRFDFCFNGFTATVVIPEKPSKKWIWRTRFLGAFDQADVAMIEQGYYLVYWDLKQMYGCPSSVEMLKDFHDMIVSMYNLEEKATLFGFSRGGLYAVNFATAYPELVDVLYLDAPVVDLFSWPKGDGKSVGSKSDWSRCKKYCNVSQKTKQKYEISLHQKMRKLASCKIPLILVSGDSDNEVPYAENGARLIEEYERTKSPYKLILKKGFGHHPHSLEEPKEIVDFIQECRSIK